jgi:hypothetical protein
VSEQQRTTSEEARRVGDAIGVDWQRFDLEQFRAGIDVEFEHGAHDPQTNVTDDDPIITGKIACGHMKEFPDYYDRLEGWRAGQTRVGRTPARVVTLRCATLASVALKGRPRMSRGVRRGAGDVARLSLSQRRAADPASPSRRDTGRGLERRSGTPVAVLSGSPPVDAAWGASRGGPNAWPGAAWRRRSAPPTGRAPEAARRGESCDARP